MLDRLLEYLEEKKQACAASSRSTPLRAVPDLRLVRALQTSCCSILDAQWKDHLHTMDGLREGIGLRGYAQRDPKIEYQREGFALFGNMDDRIDLQAVETGLQVRAARRPRLESAQARPQAQAQSRLRRPGTLGVPAPPGIPSAAADGWCAGPPAAARSTRWAATTPVPAVAVRSTRSATGHDRGPAWRAAGGPVGALMVEGAPPSVPGFRASGLCCGIKQGAPDLALIESECEASVAGVFTRSTVVGAPVERGREQVRTGRARAVVVNSGISNVAMGERGRRDAESMAKLAARAIGCEADQVFVASTGVIGEPLPMKCLREGIPRAAAALRDDGLGEAAEAIRTTDTFAKLASARVRVAGRPVTIAGIAKGSGMLEPNMATMLSFLVTDAAADPRYLRGLLRRVADDSYNRVTIDGETSTSDTVLLFANGRAGNPRLRGPRSPRRAALRVGGGRGGGAALPTARPGWRGSDQAGHGGRARGAQRR